MKYAFILSVFVGLNVVIANAQTTVTLKPVSGNGKDATITTQVPTANYGIHPDLGGITWSCQSLLCNGRGLIEYDLSFIPAGSVINSATLYLYANNNSLNGYPGQPTYGSDNAGYLRRITQSWDENTVTWNNQPLTTAVNQVLIPQSTSTSQDYVLNVTALTQDIIDNPTSGYGFMLMEANETNFYNSQLFCSSDIADTNLAPALVVNYTAPSGMICFEVQPNAAEGKDAVITTQVPGANYGTLVDFLAMTWTCQSVLCLGRSLIEFDLSAIPATAHIDTAFLFLYANNNSPNGNLGEPTYGNDNAGVLRRITQSWNENTVTWNNQPATTTQDEVNIPLSASVSQDYILNIKNLVQNSIQNPSTSFGFMIAEVNETNYYNSLIFGSSDDPIAAIHPKLKVCYTPAIAVIENDFSNVSVFPNPFSDSFTIKDQNHRVKEIAVFNTLGELMLTARFPDNVNALTVELTGSPAGIYFVQIFSEKGNQVRKIIKR